MGSSKILKYSAYAVGEIILIVVGINVALHFDNNNKEKQTQEELYKVYDIISHDLALDTLYMSEYINKMEQNRWMFDSILNGKMTGKILDTCLSCHYPAIYTTNLTFYDRGFKMLVNNAEFNSSQNDSLNGIIMEYYDYVKGHIENITQLHIRADAELNINHWKLNYSWFHDMETNPEFIKYSLNDTEYLNMVKKHHFLLYQNHLPDLKRIKTIASDLLNWIEKSKTKE